MKGPLPLLRAAESASPGTARGRPQAAKARTPAERVSIPAAGAGAGRDLSSKKAAHGAAFLMIVQ